MRSVALDDQEAVAIGVAEPEHRRYRIAHAADLVVDVDAAGLEVGVIGVDVGGVERDPGLGVAGRLAGGGGTIAIVVVAFAGATSTQR